MIGELPERFKGTPRDFFEQAYFLARYNNPHGVFRMQYPQVSDSSAKFSIGENGWALAQRLPDGGCTITLGVEGEDETMWQWLFNHLEQHRWIEKPQMRKRIFGLRADYLIATAILGISIIITSVLLFPSWETSIHTIIGLVVLAFVAAINFVANFRKAFE